MRAFRNGLELGRPWGRNLVFRVPVRYLAIKSRGSPICKEDLFKYTNGRFLADEDDQRSKRFVRFDADRLCDVIAEISGTGTQPVSTIEKMEGGFSKVLLMKTADGSEYIVKIPCPNAGRPMYCTASEVAVLDFVRKHTTIPVPRVLAWCVNSANPVGAEYIVMERVPGVQLFNKWEEMGESRRLSFIKQLTKWKSELSGICFPAYGSLYTKGSLKDHESISLDLSIDPGGVFCVGPSCTTWSTQHGSPGIHHGPWMTLSNLGESLINRSLQSVQNLNPELPASIRGTAEEHTLVLNMAKEIIPAVANNPYLLGPSQPTLWHTDLHMGNIFVAEDDPSNVTGFIDWQHSSISPLFLQARWPVVLTPPGEYEEGTVMPQLPPNYEDMDDYEKELARYNKAKATWSKAYEIATYLNNRKAWQGMQVPDPLKELFRRCGTTWDEGIVPLRETLLEIVRSQDDLGFEGSLPIHFTKEQIAHHKKELKSYRELHKIRGFVKDMLDTDDDGWVPPERDLEEVKGRNKMLFDYYVAKMGKDRAPDEIRSMWPFPLDT
ncbi:hypothetical protein P168DRAFT_98163 [Aspergillus campestris IBT 28561]|uniref:Altered inheritance of mitochondria protein 9, mitochondrial n=1 Tax=Aspergillus campestris (strain IBT 28561) TaxID=1392248 RepID=A0A2I1DCG4_ASPC2|nr:uncharacterized protein P168DRAFT_98163 [Aspergillus campestris IBT 28561]PKY07566.1 hypothetical protein P168DRAFT_98163 [Aspergillus campestris IBT 28561]